MSLNHSASIVRNGLVFYYDMGNTQKSWKGKPTTNYATTTLSSWSVDGSGQGNIGARTIISSYYARIDDNASNCRQSSYVEGLSASTMYTFSIKYRRLTGVPTLRFQLQAYNGGTYLSTMAFPTTAQLGITDIDGWQTAYYTVTTPANTTRAMWFVQDGDDYTTYTHSFEVKEPQCETGTFPTLFVSGSRNTSQTLLDLTGIHTIPLLNASYSADNTFDITGQNNGAVNSSYYSNTNNTSRTWEVFARPNTSPSTAGLFGHVVSEGCTYYCNGGLAIASSKYCLNWYDNSSYQFLDSSVTATANQWVHVAGTFNGSDQKHRIYINGELKATSAATNNNYGGGTNNWQLGYFSASGNSFSGKIAIARYYYNKCLSDLEVLQNFNAQRDRYGI